MKPALLEVTDLAVSFDSLPAVRGITFTVREGETVGIVGESGSGKSAAVQAVTGLTKGRVTGQILFERSPSLEGVLGRKIGMIFQDPQTSLNPTMRIGAQIMEGPLFHRLMSRKEARANTLELLRLVGIPDPHLRFSQYPHQLSGGMKQRVLIAIAIACNPRLIIADEKEVLP